MRGEQHISLLGVRERAHAFWVLTRPVGTHQFEAFNPDTLKYLVKSVCPFFGEGWRRDMPSTIAAVLGEPAE